MVTVRRPSRPPAGFRRAARRRLRLVAASEAALLVAQADASYPALAALAPPARRGGRNLLSVGAYAAALKRAMTADGWDDDAALGLLSDALFASIVHSRDLLDAISRVLHRDPRDALVWASNVARRLYYAPPDWAMAEVEVEDGFGIDITRCVVAEYLASLGEIELCQRVICDQDIRSAARRGVGFTRTTTLAGGGSRCDFRYRIAGPADAETRPRRESAVTPHMSGGA